MLWILLVLCYYFIPIYHYCWNCWCCGFCWFYVTTSFLYIIIVGIVGVVDFVGFMLLLRSYISLLLELLVLWILLVLCYYFVPTYHIPRECAPPYPQRDRKRRLNGAVCRNHRIKKVVPCRC